MIKTAVVILNWNGIDWLKKFLGTVVKYTSNNDSLIYMVDNGSTDGSADFVSGNFSSINIIRFEKNYGFAEGYNLALEQIEAQYFVLLNSDVEVSEGWLNPLIEFMDQNPDVASCQPKIRSYHKKDYFEYAGAAGGYVDKFGYTFCRGRIFDVVEKDIGQYDTRGHIFWSTGACMIVRSDAWKSCGGFDADFFAHMEEVDLCWRFHLAGFHVSCIPESIVYHVGGGILPYNSDYKAYLNFRNNLYLLYKNLPDNQLHTTLFIRKILDFTAAVMFTFKGKTGIVKAIWKSHVDYYKSLKSLKEKRQNVKNLTVVQICNTIVNNSVVFRFYIKGEKTFSALKIKF